MMQKLDAEIGSKLEDWYRYVENSRDGAAPQPVDASSAAKTPRGRRRFRFSPGSPQHQIGAASAPRRTAPEPIRETRQELLARLLDPVLTLDETAQVLDVCPTTVRRYTNRGLLAHHRTVGNQRRFRLSDVLAFLSETSERAEAGTLKDDTVAMLAELSAARRLEQSKAVSVGTRNP